MKTSDWKSVAEIIGIGAIVASLVFVGMQIKQSQEIAISTQYQERANAAVEMFTGNMQSDISLRLTGDRLRLGIFGPESQEILQEWALERTPQELAWQFNNFLMVFAIYDNNHFQYSAGFLDEDSWLSFDQRMKNVLTNPVNRAMFKQMSLSFRAPFREIAENVIAEIESKSN